MLPFFSLNEFVLPKINSNASRFLYFIALKNFPEIFSSVLRKLFYVLISTVHRILFNIKKQEFIQMQKFLPFFQKNLSRIFFLINIKLLLVSLRQSRLNNKSSFNERPTRFAFKNDNQIEVRNESYWIVWWRKCNFNFNMKITSYN